MTRSEEELAVGTRRRETGRARLRKYVETENVQQTVPVQREEVRLEREPITDANAGRPRWPGDLGGGARGHAPHRGAGRRKRTVPKERVRLDKEVHTDEETVSEDVRRERIDVR